MYNKSEGGPLLRTPKLETVTSRKPARNRMFNYCVTINMLFANPLLHKVKRWGELLTPRDY